MEVNLTPETEARLQDLVTKTGRAKDDLMEDAVAGYLVELNELRQLLEDRYEQIRSGHVGAIDGEEAFEALRRKSANRRAAR